MTKLKKFAAARNQTGKAISQPHHDLDSAERLMIGALESRTYFTTTFSGPVNHPGVATPTSIAVADFVSGSPGIVVSGYAPSVTTIPVAGVYLQSARAFGLPTINPFNGTAGGVTTGDFLNNGDQDFAAVDSSTNTLNVFLNNGQGDFSVGVGASLGGTSGDTALATADFNGDGEADIAAVDPTDDQVVTFLSTTNGAFVAGQNVSVPSPIDVVAADFNGDNHPDLAILSSNGTVFIALNDGNGGFNPPIAYSLEAAGADPASMVVANLDGNTSPDMAFISSTAAGGQASAIVLLNNGDGTFGPASVVATVPTNPVSILSGNFTGSGHTDLAVLDAGGGLTVIPGNGDGTFAAPQAIFTNQLTVGSDAVAADFNGDGLTDVAYLDSANGGFSELLNTTGSGTVTPPVTPISPVTPVTPVTPTPPITASAIVPALSGAVPAVSLVAGQKVRPISEVVKLTNSSAATIRGKVSVTLTLSQTTTGAAGDPVVATYPARLMVLKSGRTAAIRLAIRSIPAALSGRYYIRATLVDPSADTNSVATAATINVVPATVDLTGAVISSPAIAIAGKAAALTFSVINLGTIAAVGPLTIDIDTSDIAGIDSTSTPFDVVTVRHINIKPGKAIRIRIRKIVAAGTASAFYFVVVVDPNDAFADVNLANNVFSSNPIAVS